MDWGIFNANEYTAYWVGYYSASAARWRERAKLKQLNDEDGSSCLDYAQEDEAERDRLMSILTKRKEQAKCSAE